MFKLASHHFVYAAVVLLLELRRCSIRLSSSFEIQTKDADALYVGTKDARHKERVVTGMSLNIALPLHSPHRLRHTFLFYQQLYDRLDPSSLEIPNSIKSIRTRKPAQHISHIHTDLRVSYLQVVKASMDQSREKTFEG